MIRSMTGFGRCLKEDETSKISVEIKAVNHRYCEASVKLPKRLNFFEPNVRTVLKQYIERGKLDLFVLYEDCSEKTESVKYNEEIAREYMDCIQQMSEQFGIENDIRASVLSRMPEVLSIGEKDVDEKEIWGKLEPVLRQALEQLVRTRETEGEHLKQDIEKKLEGMLKAVTAIESRSPQIVSEYREKVKEKVQELLGNSAKTVDETALATEIVIFADKICVDEETVRLRSHITAMKDTLNSGSAGGIGRKLDFIAQEMNREANTILSKANDMEISNYAISLKTDIEKIREQIQNIE